MPRNFGHLFATITCSATLLGCATQRDDKVTELGSNDSMPELDSQSRKLSQHDETRGVYHIVESGSTVIAIIRAYNSELKRTNRKARVSISMIKEANPRLNVDRIKPRDKIFIPIID